MRHTFELVNWLRRYVPADEVQFGRGPAPEHAGRYVRVLSAGMDIETETFAGDLVERYELWFYVPATGVSDEQREQSLTDLESHLLKRITGPERGNGVTWRHITASLQERNSLEGTATYNIEITRGEP